MKKLVYEIIFFKDMKKEVKIGHLKKEIENYLGLEEIYEEKNYLNLLKRKTTKKEKELNVVLIYLKNTSRKEFQSSVSFKHYTFKKVLTNYRNRANAITSLRMNLPAFQKNVSFLKDKIRNMDTFYTKPFKDYKLKELLDVNTQDIDLEEEQEKSFTFISFKNKDLSIYKKINAFVKKSKNTLFVFTSDSNPIKKTKSKKRRFLEKSTFLSFSFPENLEPSFFDSNKTLGQEDIMTTIYNIALSEKSYLSLGDDAFIDSNSNGINEDIYADQTGVIIEGQYYSFKSSSISSKEKKVNRDYLFRRYESAKIISNYILLVRQNFQK